MQLAAGSGFMWFMRGVLEASAADLCALPGSGLIALSGLRSPEGGGPRVASTGTWCQTRLVSCVFSLYLSVCWTLTCPVETNRWLHSMEACVRQIKRL